MLAFYLYLKILPNEHSLYELLSFIRVLHSLSVLFFQEDLLTKKFFHLSHLFFSIKYQSPIFLAFLDFKLGLINFILL